MWPLRMLINGAKEGYRERVREREEIEKERNTHNLGGKHQQTTEGLG